MDQYNGNVHTNRVNTVIRAYQPSVAGRNRRKRSQLQGVGAIWFVALLAIWLGTGMGRAYAADGDLDTSFGGDGKATSDLPNLAQGMAIQPDGKIVMSGRINESFNWGLARFNANGSLDTTFDGDGIVASDFGNFAFAVAIQSDGKIVAAGDDSTNGDLDFAVARYNANGSLDTTFDGDGHASTSFGTEFDRAYAVAIQSDGKIILAGLMAPGNGDSDFALARYNTNGSLDTTFDGDGKLTTDFGSHDLDRVQALVIQSDGKIVAVGHARTGFGANYNFALARYNANGSLDTSFDGDGLVVTEFSSSWDDAFGVAIQADGKIVAAGDAYDGDDRSFALARYNANGSLDTTFDGDGKLMTAIDGTTNDGAAAVVIQYDNKIVAGGYTAPSLGADRDFALTRYLPNGTLDTSFGGDGKITTDFGNSTDTITRLAIQADGKIVAGGGSSDGAGVARYQSSGGGPPPTPTATPTLAPGQKFYDVPPGSTFYTYINCLVDEGVISGYPDQTFRPQNDITRGQLSKVIANAAGYNEAVSGQTFSDVPPGSPFYEFVERMASRGIIGGYGDGTFKPGNNATRGQISKIVSNAKGYSEAVSGQRFTDVPPGSTYYEFVERIASRGIIGGYGDGTFKPNNNASRGQVSKIVANAFFPDCETSAHEEAPASK